MNKTYKRGVYSVNSEAGQEPISTDELRFLRRRIRNNGSRFLRLKFMSDSYLDAFYDSKSGIFLSVGRGNKRYVIFNGEFSISLPKARPVKAIQSKTLEMVV